MKISAHTQIRFSNSISFLDKLLFTKHVGIMLKSGIPIAEAIDTIKDQSSSTFFRSVLSQITKDLENGEMLEKALSKYPKIFDSMYVNLVRIGEESGNLEENLSYLTKQLEKEHEFRQKVIAASMYPAIVLTTAVVVGGGVSFFVLPKLIDLFKSLDTNLPLATKILLAFATFSQKYGIYVIIGLIALFTIFKYSLRYKSFKYLWDKLVLATPVIGKLVQGVQMTFICRNLGTMLKSGLPIVKAMKAQEISTANLVYREYIAKLATSIEKGKSIKETLEEGKFKYIPKIAVKMIGVGEKTGKLDESFLYLGDFFEDSVDDASKNFSNVLEPLLLLVIGMVVAFVALAIISPIYQFTGSIKR